jgi:hypothetical protein
MLQPSTFGVLLVVAVCLFMRDRPFLAGAIVALAATVHSTYLLPGAMLTCGFLTALVMERRGREALAVGAWTLALVAPVTAYVLLTFGPTSADTFAEAQNIVANFRIPHHARPDLWLDPVAALQLAWVFLALVLVCRSRLFLVLAVPFVLMVLLTILQVLTGSNTLALLFPWRISAVLVPIATAVVLARLASISIRILDNPLGHAGAALLVFGLAGAGIALMAGREAFRSDDNELAVMDWVRRNRKPGDVYFIPVQVPDLKKATRGSFSSDFKPLAERKTDSKMIPIGFQRFRLYTGIPLYVDFKSIPYKDVEVIEWAERLATAERVGWDLRVVQPDVGSVVHELRRLNITHVLVQVDSREARALWGERGYVPIVFRDTYYSVFRMPRSSEDGKK